MKNLLVNQFITRSPVLVLVIFCIIYFFVGTLNISTHRGDMDWKLSIIVVAFGSIGLISGAMFYKIRLFPNINIFQIKNYYNNFGKLAAYLLIFIGFIFSINLILYNGIGLLSSSSGSRYLLSPQLLYLQEILITIPTLYIFTISLDNNRINHLIKFIILVNIIALMVSGYRGILIIYIASLSTTYYFHPNRKIKISLSQIVVCLFAIYLIVAGGFVLRRILSDNDKRIPLDEIVEVINYPDNLPAKLLLPFYLTSREGVSVFQNLHNKGSGNDNIFISDFLTLLPGKQKSGGTKVAEIVYGLSHYDYGLTPTLYGSLYYDGGPLYLLVITFFIGYYINRLYYKIRYKYNSINLMIFSLSFISIIHLMHRGVFKPIYILYIISLLFLVSFVNIVFLITKEKFGYNE